MSDAYIIKYFIISFTTVEFADKGNPNLCEASLLKKCSVEGIAQNY